MKKQYFVDIEKLTQHTQHTVRATKQKSPENKDLLNMKFTLKFNLHINYTLQGPQKYV